MNPLKNRRQFLKTSAFAGFGITVAGSATGRYLTQPIIAPALHSALSFLPAARVGMIGLDTSHCEAFTKILNQPNPESEYAGFPVVAAYPHGSKDIQSSVSRIPR